ncbi:hypothetical protein [Pseudomonas sp. Marseille-Q1929]|uniref:hypothetical protein n=1 Tax=Pseudomonas sp. Marseille-Q1929 TaxID=2730402 RepID=UPI001A8D8B1E|nr:hypothetical protein [Pseudomonas sp. Marseille-Q1929]MBO0494030.1 hypothetical protein [Pseudomonas sp. Marseille-Q1929]
MANQQWTHLDAAQGKEGANEIQGEVKEGNVSTPFSADVVVYRGSPQFEITGEQYHSLPQDPADATGVLVRILRATPPDGTYRVGEQPFGHAVILTPGDKLHLAESGFITVTNNPNTQEVSGEMHFVAGSVEIDATYKVSPQAL